MEMYMEKWKIRVEFGKEKIENLILDHICLPGCKTMKMPSLPSPQCVYQPSHTTAHSPAFELMGLCYVWADGWSFNPEINQFSFCDMRKIKMWFGFVDNGKQYQKANRADVKESDILMLSRGLPLPFQTLPRNGPISITISRSNHKMCVQI